MNNPYLTDGPTLISFSGGRTSAFMLHQILQAHGGELPVNTVVTFANTGKEREETLRFVQDCAENWSVPVVWLEWQAEDPGYRIVTFETASRNGEPFSNLIRKKTYVPNPVTRYCTIELKIRVMKKFCQKEMGWKKWKNAVGLRHDEGYRCMKAYAGNEKSREPFKAWLPLDKARVTKKDVLDFWKSRNFDLKIRGYEGNCDLCFLKGRNRIQTIIKEQGPKISDWWIEQEKIASEISKMKTGTRFILEHSYSQMTDDVKNQPGLFDDFEEFDAECGLVCGVDE